MINQNQQYYALIEMENKKILDDFKNYLIYKKAMSLSSCKIYTKDVERLLLLYPLKELNQDKVEEYLRNKDIKPRTLCRLISIFRVFSKFIVKEYNLDPIANNLDLPKLGLILPKDLDIEVIENLLGSMDETIPQELRDKALFETIYSTGVRISEAINIQLSDVDFINHTIKVLGKRDKERLVVIGYKALDLIKLYIREYRNKYQKTNCNTLFITKYGKTMSRVNAYKRLQIYANRIGLDKTSIHSLRHSFATHMLKNNGDLLVVSELLGHASLKTTELYTHLTIDDLQESYEKAFENF